MTINLNTPTEPRTTSEKGRRRTMMEAEITETQRKEIPWFVERLESPGVIAGLYGIARAAYQMQEKDKRETEDARKPQERKERRIAKKASEQQRLDKGQGPERSAQHPDQRTSAKGARGQYTTRQLSTQEGGI